jgi:transposase-like protein
MPRPIRTLSEIEFERTVAYMRISEENIAIVRKVLVQGVPVSLVAKETGNKSPQAIEKAVRRVWCRFLESQNIPKGWMTIRVSLPIQEAMQVKARERELRQLLVKENIFNSSNS